MGTYRNIPRDSYTPRGEPLTPELLALIDSREKATADELAAAQRQAGADRERETARTITTIPTAILEAELSRRAERGRLADLYRDTPLMADELRTIKENTLEFAMPIWAQIRRAEAEGDNGPLIALRRQLLSIIQNAQSLARTAALQERAREIITGETD
jgi:hypothetical protein